MDYLPHSTLVKILLLQSLLKILQNAHIFILISINLNLNFYSSSLYIKVVPINYPFIHPLLIHQIILKSRSTYSYHFY
jgi:hypothetical protein